MADRTAALSSYEERRQYPRLSVELALDYWQTPEEIKGGVVINLSEKGLLMQTVHKIEIGSEIGIRIYFTKQNRLDCVEGNARIVRMDRDRELMCEGYRYGVFIMQMPPDYYDKLTNYLLMLKEEQNSPR